MHLPLASHWKLNGQSKSFPQLLSTGNSSEEREKGVKEMTLNVSRLTAALVSGVEKEGTRGDVSHCEFVDIAIMQITVMHHVACLSGLVGDVVMELVANAFGKV